MQKIVQSKWFAPLSLLIVILIGAYLRFTGINWDQNFHLHPDERFLTMVETSISSVDYYREYFDTDVSSLNPHNVIDNNGNQTFPFFVYGTFPIILVRYVAELINQTSYSEINIVGRYLSGIFDVGTIILTFLIARKIFNSKRIGLLAASFYAFAPLPIQISHFFIVDNFTTFFAMLAILFAVRVMKFEQTRSIQLDDNESWRFLIKNWDGFANYALFALALGLATASKINAVAVAILLPLGVLLSNYQSSISLKNKRIQIVFRNLIIAGLLSFLFFRIFQPYAFSGPGIFNFSFNEKWLNNIKELQALSSGLSNYPPSLQWTRRSILFPLKNMLFWGIGPVQGFLAVAGLAMMLVRVLRGDWNKYGLLLLWNLFYISWQATRWNPTMRYFLLVYPTMAITAGWTVFEIGKRFLNKKCTSQTIKYFRWVTFGLILITTFLWGY